MSKHAVHVEREIARPADAVWAVAREFCGLWHPALASVTAERSAAGGLIRCFTVTGEDTVYRELLTLQSDTDRTLSYRHLEGIAGVEHYAATLAVLPLTSTTCRFTWSADVEAPEPRASQIAEGTRAVFEMGIDALMAAAVPVRRALPPVPDTPTRDFTIPGDPAAVLTSAGLVRGDTLCLFLHGIGGGRHNWLRQLPVAAQHMPAAALDLRGYGGSTLGPVQTTVDDVCADILQVMAHFQAKRLVLVGLSYGSWLATSFAMRHTEKLAGLVLSGGCTGMSEAGPEERQRFRQAREVPLDAGKTPSDFAPAVVDVIASPGASAEIRQQLFDSMAAIPAATYRDALRCFTNPPEAFDFSGLNLPVLFITGDHDRLAPPAEIRAVAQRVHAAARMPNVRFEVIPGAGHVCNVEQPEAYNALLDEFLLGLPRNHLPGAYPVAVVTAPSRKALKRQRILDAALKVFAQEGYAGTSMEAIAAAAGVSKPTLYTYFGAKELLFEAIMASGRDTMLEPFEHATQDLVADLHAFAWRYAGIVMDPQFLSLARLIIAEAQRFPAIGRAYQQAGPDRVLAGIMAYFMQQRAAGRLVFADAELAAQDFWALILSAPRNQALHMPDAIPASDEIARSLHNGLAVFLKAYSTHPADDLARLQDVVSTPQTTGEHHAAAEIH
jgi:pimeloyl-ACP methyl ester carboxylesterase/AcrR family transcriptional regulator